MPSIINKNTPGGYVLFSLGGIEFTDEPLEIEGLSDRLKEAINTGKPVYICDFSVDTDYWAWAPKTPVPVTLYADDETYVLATLGITETKIYLMRFALDLDQVGIEISEIAA